MRRPEPSPLLLLLACIGVSAALAPVACATTGNIESVMGGAGGTGSTTAGPGVTTVSTTVAVTAGTGMQSRSCGVSNSNPACESCLLVACCAEANTCAGDGPCVECVGAPTPAASCQSEASYTALIACLEQSCADRCGLPSPPTGAGGTGGSSSSTSTSTTTTTTTTTVASSSTTVASSTSSSSSGTFATVSTSSSVASSTSSSGGGAGGSSSGGLYTCPDVDFGVGCCDAGGKLFFCDVHGQVYEGICEGGSVCGWSADEGFYDCVAPPGGADPSGTYPLACMGP
jgi:hypothetical protein